MPTQRPDLPAEPPTEVRRRPARGDLPTRIIDWLEANASQGHRARDVAAGLGVPDGMTRAVWSQKVANALARLQRHGEVDVESAGDPDTPGGRPGGHPLRLYRARS